MKREHRFQERKSRRELGSKAGQKGLGCRRRGRGDERKSEEGNWRGIEG